MIDHPGHSVPMSLTWRVQPDQAFASGEKGEFAIKQIEITPQRFRFYYAFNSAQTTDLRVTASAWAPSKLSDVSTNSLLAVVTEKLGQLGSYTFGVIQAERRSLAGQLITLEIIPIVSTKNNGSTWQLSPLKQLQPEAHADTSWSSLHVSPSGLPRAEWTDALMEQQVRYAKVILSDQSVTDRSYVFVRSDDPVVVRVISKAEYLAIAGSANFIP